MDYSITFAGFFSAGWSVNLSCFPGDLILLKTGENFKLYFAAEIRPCRGKKCSSRHKLYTRKHAILNNKIFAHLACYACILLGTISSGLYF